VRWTLAQRFNYLAHANLWVPHALNFRGALLVFHLLGLTRHLCGWPALLRGDMLTEVDAVE
jgi:hypothetical protein